MFQIMQLFKSTWHDGTLSRHTRNLSVKDRLVETQDLKAMFWVYYEYGNFIFPLRDSCSFEYLP